MIGAAKLYFITFGVLTIIGGVIGYVKAGSAASIIAGSISGILLIVAAFLVPVYVMVGLVLGLLISLALAWRFVPAFIHKGGIMPAGLMAVLSVIGVLVALAGLFKR